MWTTRAGSVIVLFCSVLSSCDTQRSREIPGEIATLLVEFLNTRHAVETVARDVKRTYSPGDERRVAVQHAYNEGRAAIGRYFGALRAATQIGEPNAMAEITSVATADVAGVLNKAITAIAPDSGVSKSIPASKLPDGVYRAFQAVPARNRMQAVRDVELRVSWVPWEEL